MWWLDSLSVRSQLTRVLWKLYPYKFNHCHPYKLQLHHHLCEEDPDRRFSFANWQQTMMGSSLYNFVLSWSECICFPDKSTVRTPDTNRQQVFNCSIPLQGRRPTRNGVVRDMIRQNRQSLLLRRTISGETYPNILREKALALLNLAGKSWYPKCFQNNSSSQRVGINWHKIF